MKNKLKLLFLASLFLSSLCAQTKIDGFWLIPDDDNNNKIESAVIFYKHGDAHYCKMLVIYDEDTGKPTDTVKSPIERAKGIAGAPYLCGMDFIWGLKYESDSDRYAGHVIDPDSGKKYRCEVWYDTDKKMLVVRGELFIFGKNEYWAPADEKYLPTSERPDAAKIRPHLPFLQGWGDGSMLAAPVKSNALAESQKNVAETKSAVASDNVNVEKNQSAQTDKTAVGNSSDTASAKVSKSPSRNPVRH